MSCDDLTGKVYGDFIIIERDYNYGKERGLKEWGKKNILENKMFKVRK